MMEYLTALDGEILLFLQNVVRTPVLDRFFIFITHLGDKGLLWITLALVLLLFPKYRKNGIAMGIALTIGLLITNILLKNLIQRIRPYDVIAGLEPLIARPTDWSFPSGHTTSSIAASVALILTMRNKCSLLILIPGILIPFSRLYVGVHYPTDVLAGALIGLFAAYCAAKAVKQIRD